MTETADTTAALDMDQVKIDPRWALRIPANLAMRRRLLPFTSLNGQVLVACADPADAQGLEAVERYVQLPVVPHLAQVGTLERALQKIFGEVNEAAANQASPLRVAFANRGSTEGMDGDEVVAFSDEIFHAAMIRLATDVHVEPGENDVRIRLRVDGLLEEYRRYPLGVHNALISRIKVLAGMDIAERRAPQDGRFTLNPQFGSPVDVRAATIPTKHGERLTLRLLAMQATELTMEKLGMSSRHLETISDCLRQPNGLIVLTGPTGCGKSTTLYAAIRMLLAGRPLNIITIEDPVEYVVDGVSQVEVDVADKVNFHKALRSVLRHDPDVLMIGEIRDEQTAEIAVKASLTGHLVLTSLHTNSAISTVNRLADMNVKPFLISSISRLFVAQRLVRKLCQHCRRPSSLSEDQARLLGNLELTGCTVYEPEGCKYCAGRGFAGRSGLFEMIPFDRELSQLVANRRSEVDIGGFLTARGIGRLMDDAVEKMKLGVTTAAEIIAVVNA